VIINLTEISNTKYQITNAKSQPTPGYKLKAEQLESNIITQQLPRNWDFPPEADQRAVRQSWLRQRRRPLAEKIN